MKRIGLILLGLVLFTAFLHAEDVRYRRPLRIDQTWSKTPFNNTPLDGTATNDTSVAYYVGDIYLPSLTYFYKADDNTTGGASPGDSVDYNVSPDFWIPNVGWMTQDHNAINRSSDVSWQIFHDRAPPRIIAAAVSDPGGGQNLSYTATANVDDMVYGVDFILKTSADVGNRYVKVYFKDSNGNLIAGAQCRTAQPANKNILYSFFPGAQDVYNENAAHATAPMPENVRLRFGSTVSTQIVGLDNAGADRDTLTAVVISSLRDVDVLVNYHSPDMADSIRFVADPQANNGSDVDIYLVVTAMYLRSE